MFRFAICFHKGQVDHFVLSSCSWEDKTTETDAIQFQVYSLDHVTEHEILFIQSGRSKSNLYSQSVCSQVNSREALNKNAPITFHYNISYL